jgi:hypothetical protein
MSNKHTTSLHGVANVSTTTAGRLSAKNSRSSVRTLGVVVVSTTTTGQVRTLGVVVSTMTAGQVETLGVVVIRTAITMTSERLSTPRTPETAATRSSSEFNS